MLRHLVAGHNAPVRQVGTPGPEGPWVFPASLKAVCQQAQRVLGSVSERRAVMLYERYVREFRALFPPPGERGTYSKFVGSLQHALIDFKAGASILRSGGNRGLATAITLAGQLGVPGCGQLMPEMGGY